MANEFKIRKGLIVEGATGGTVVDVQGSLGQLFSVTDNLTGEIFAVADISGVPIMTINSSSATVFTGLVSGITPVAAANFVTKAYVDGGGGAGSGFLPLSAGSGFPLTGDLYLATASNEGNLFFGTASASYKIFGGGTYGYMGYDTGGFHRFNVLGSEVVRIYAGNIQFKDNGIISTNTADGADNAQLSLAGGGADSDGRGARARLYGNEHASLPGAVDISTGNIAGSDMYLGATDNMIFSTGGTESMRITDTGSVIVGIATVAAANAAADNIVIKGEGNAVGLTISNSLNAGTGTIFFGDAASSAAAGFRYNHNTGDMAISAEDNVTFACDNVGIGTTNPDDKLDVTDGNSKMVFGGASSDRPLLYFQHNAVPVDGEEIGLLDFRGYNDASQDTRYVILTAKAEDVTDGSEDGSLQFQIMKAGTATNTMVLRSGNVGMGGQTAPSQALDVSGKIRLTDDLQLDSTSPRLDYDNGAAGSLRLFSTSQNATKLSLTSAGALQLNAYGAGTLVSDASGNITVSSGGGAGGPFLPLAGGTMTLTSTPLILPQEEANAFKIEFKGASSSSGISTVDQSGSGLYIGANSRVNNSGTVITNDTNLPSFGINFDGWSQSQMEFYTGNSGSPSVRLTIDSSGRAIFRNTVVINGTSVPFTGSELDVRGDIVLIEQNWALRGNNSNADFCIEELGSSFSDANVKLVVKSGGDVGIGTISPEDKLEVSGGSLKIKVVGSASLASSIKFGRSDQASGNFENHISSMTGSGASQCQIQFLVCNTSATGRTKLLTLDGGNARSLFQGAVGIGNTSASEALEVTGNIFVSAKFGNLVAGTEGIQFESPSSTLQTCRFDSDALRFFAGGGSPQGQTRFTITESAGSTFVNTVTATNFILSSDKRLKENIKTLEPKVISAQWKSFNAKDDDSYRTGVIAQELEIEHPEFVETNDKGFKSVKYIDLLISKIAELEHRIKQLEK